MSIPVILCERAGTSQGVPQWSFWCPHCKRRHHHGGEPNANGELGHRIAHCGASSPWYADGYVLRCLPGGERVGLPDIR